MAISEAKIAEVTHRLVSALRPETVVLFGSHAWGQPGPDSDLDLLVIVSDSDEPPYRRAQAAYRSLYGVRVPCDVLVHTRREIDAARQVRSSLLRRIMEEGQVVYGRA
jgi:uncharacterized protein